jgi:hypothetical protein
MRRGPADVEEVGQHGVAGLRLHERGLVGGMRLAFHAGHEERAHRDRVGARGQRAARGGRIGDAARRHPRAVTAPRTAILTCD